MSKSVFFFLGKSDYIPPSLLSADAGNYIYIYICIYGGCVDILPTIWQGQKIYALGLLLWPVDFVISASGASSHCADHSQLHAAAPPARPGDGASPEGPIVCNIAALKGRLIGS